VSLDTSAEAAAAAYTNSLKGDLQLADVGLRNRLDRTSGAVRFSTFRFEDEEGNEKLSFKPGDTIRIHLSCQAQETVASLGFIMQLWSDKSNEQVTSLKGVISEQAVTAGTIYQFKLSFPCNALRPGDYRLYTCLGNKTCTHRFYDVVDDNVGIPRLSINSADTDPHLLAGYFSIPWSIQIEKSG
jgi:hypothetical protein